MPPPSPVWDIFQLIAITHGCPGHTQPTVVSEVCHSGLICLSTYTAWHKPLQKVKGKLCLLSYRGVICPWPRQRSRVGYRHAALTEVLLGQEKWPLISPTRGPRSSPADTLGIKCTATSCCHCSEPLGWWGAALAAVSHQTHRTRRSHTSSWGNSWEGLPRSGFSCKQAWG